MDNSALKGRPAKGAVEMAARIELITEVDTMLQLTEVPVEELEKLAARCETAGMSFSMDKIRKRIDSDLRK